MIFVNGAGSVNNLVLAHSNTEHTERVSIRVYVDAREAANGPLRLTITNEHPRPTRSRRCTRNRDLARTIRAHTANVPDRAQHRGCQGHRRRRRRRIDGMPRGLHGRNKRDGISQIQDNSYVEGLGDNDMPNGEMTFDTEEDGVTLGWVRNGSCELENEGQNNETTRTTIEIPQDVGTIAVIARGYG